MGTCTLHCWEMHWHIERMAEQYLISVGGRPVVPAVILTCEQIEQILEDVVCRATGHELSHKAVPCAYMNERIPHLACGKCGYLLTLDVEDAYREIVLGYSPCGKQNPRS